MFILMGVFHFLRIISVCLPLYVDRARLIVALHKLHHPHSALLPMNPTSLMTDISVFEFATDSPQVVNRGLHFCVVPQYCIVG
jgi:hypothetical protein